MIALLTMIENKINIAECNFQQSPNDQYMYPNYVFIFKSYLDLDLNTNHLAMTRMKCLKEGIQSKQHKSHMYGIIFQHFNI